MAMASKCGLMEPATRETGKITELKDLENSPTLMVIYTKETGSMTKPTAMESISTSTVQDMKGTGWMTCSMEWARSPGLTALSTKGNTSQVRSTVAVSIAGMMAQSITVTGKKTK